jgi:hypothetical protein
MKLSLVRLAVGVVALTSIGTLSSVAAAQEVVVRAGPAPDDVSTYPIEIEPHFTFGTADIYGNAGFGGGLRLSVPVVGGRIGRVPDNLAVSFGGDILAYENCYYGSYCSADYVMLPVAAQWNVWVAPRVSLFAEGGVFVYDGWYSSCQSGDPGCQGPSTFGVLPTIAVGGRVHLGRNASLTARIGYPTITLGVSLL